MAQRPDQSMITVRLDPKMHTAVKVLKRKTGLSINQIMVESLDEALAHGEEVIIGNNAPEFADVPSRLGAQQSLIDLVRLGGTDQLGERYDGINW